MMVDDMQFVLHYFSMTIRTVLIAIVLFVPSRAVANPPLNLRADTESQLVQNEQADADNLSRMEDQAMVERYARLRLLVPVPADTRDYYVHNMPEARRYLRPWSKLFLDRLSRQYRSRFGKSMRITSLVRTEDYQSQLRNRNGNAAPPDGEKRSTHLTGASLDISKKGMTGAEQRWVRRVLHSLKQKGYLFAVEEFSQPNFHVMVYKSYLDYVETKLASR